MSDINACIVSFFMDNLNPKTVEYQKRVVEKYNVSKYPHYIIRTNISHPLSIDYFWTMNGIQVNTMKGNNIEKKVDHDIIMCLDIDCVPLSETAIDLYIEKAANGKLVGNAQRTNHLDNNQHVFAAPSALAISADSFITIGSPSAIETGRGDVAEEYTFAAEKSGIVPVELFMPLKFDAVPLRQVWETDQRPFWPLADGMPNYGIGTTYGDEEHGELFYHNFQIRYQEHEKRFWDKCESILVN